MIKKITLSFIILFSICLYFLSGTIIKRVTLDRYEFINSIDEVSLSFNNIHFKNVTGIKNNKEFTFNNVKYYFFNDCVYLEGGSIKAELSNSSKINSSNDETTNIIFDNIIFDIIYKNYIVKINQTSGTLKSFSASDLTVSEKDSQKEIFKGDFVRGSFVDKEINIENSMLKTKVSNNEIVVNINKLCYNDNLLKINKAIINDIIFIDDITYNKLDNKAHINNLVLNHKLVSFNLKDISLIKKDNLFIVDFNGFIVELSIDKKEIKFNGACDKLANILQLDDKFKGNISGDISMSEMHMDVKSTCAFETCSNNRMNGFNSSFKYYAYKKDKKTRIERVSGPNSPNWVNFEYLPIYIPEMFIFLEDPAFYKHSGVIIQALENSLKDNIRYNKFVRGGSTITMQLVKNIWLDRDKNLTRKAKEVMLAWGLEKCTTKQRIIETYLNVVEFGPDVYGIAAGSDYHFGVAPDMLEPIEAFYLASIMPRPTNASLGRESLDKARKHAERLLKTGYLSEQAAIILGLDKEEMVEEE